MKARAIITLIVGETYQRVFNEWFREDWERYCSRHDIDLIAVGAPIDSSPRALSRSPAWQKCILHRHPDIAKYGQVAWIDADIRIRPDSPDLFSIVARERVGAVDENSIPTVEDNSMATDRLYTKWDKAGVKYVRNKTPQEFHRNFGIQADWDHVVQTGVLVFSPKLHGNILERAYNNYEDKGDPSWNYEMRPLSHELQSAGCMQWLSPKFNMLWSLYEEIYYPFLASKRRSTRLQRQLQRLCGDPNEDLRRQCLEAAIRNNYFLHFVGGSTDFKRGKPGSSGL